MTKSTRTMRKKRTTNKPSSDTVKGLRWLLIPGSAVLLALLLNLYILVFATVPSGSMVPTVPEGSLLLGSRLAYCNTAPERGDIVFFHHPELGRSLILKRVIAVGGDTFEILDGQVWINGQPLKEPYATGQSRESFPAIAVPEGKLILLGDNRDFSTDSRFWEDPFVDEANVVAKATFLIYPGFHAIS